MQKSFRAIGAAALIGLGIWLWWIFFPSPERAIRSRVNALAKTISFKAGDGIVSRGYHAEKAAGFFTTNVEINVDIHGFRPFEINGRDEVLQALMYTARTWRELKVEFLDVNITLAPDKQSATANLTGKANAPGERDFDVQEFNFYFRKTEDGWMIYKVETVNTLSSLLPRNKFAAAQIKS
jgi:hypothetical protein